MVFRDALRCGSARRRLAAALVVILTIGTADRLSAEEPQPEIAFQPKLLIAFSAYHPRAKYPTIYFYEHDGVALGKVVGSVAVSGKRSDYHASLSIDGRYCAFASEEENNVSKVLVWDRKEEKLVDLPNLNDSTNAQLYASLSGDGKLLAHAAWSHPQAQGRWDILLYDTAAQRRLLLSEFNTVAHDERMPSLSADGSTLAYVSNQHEAGQTDIYLYEFPSGEITHDPVLNSPQRDLEPSLSADGDLVAFTSDRPGGEGGSDIYLYQRSRKTFLPLPGLNYVAHEQCPKLSPDGRYLVFSSERTAGEGESDIYLYDRTAGKLLPCPGLNGKYEDIDPSIVILPRAE